MKNGVRSNFFLSFKEFYIKYIKFSSVFNANRKCIDSNIYFSIIFHNPLLWVYGKKIISFIHTRLLPLKWHCGL